MLPQSFVTRLQVCQSGKEGHISVRFIISSTVMENALYSFVGATAEQQKIAANKAAIAADNKRFGELGDYNILGEATVYFGNGKTAIDPQYQPQLLQLAQQAKGVTAYTIQVQGYASAVGSAALNQRLSSERADAVTAFLEQQGQIPLTNMLAPGAMGTTSQVGSDTTAEGQSENRRVVVRILQNKGIAGT